MIAHPLAAQQAYSGRARALNVMAPRIEAEISIDGVLAEPVWREAAVLRDFSQYRPVDGRASEDSTQVLVWYDSHAIYFGIRAFEAHAPVRATLADRDRIDGEDYTQILLDPFNDRRRAWIFGVNPLGVQADGIRTEGSPGAASGPGAGGRFENVDLNPDFVFASKGHVTDYGYEVEVRVPFKSIRYQSVDPQSWAINVLRKVQHSGYEDTWTPALRANASFLAQSGELNGLTELKRGLVLDLNPFVTTRVTGAPSTDGWSYDAAPETGANARWGMTTNLTVDATINPDFSQVEADVGQVTVNERFNVFFPEKRPFFLEGIENFDTPNQLIYTRQIVDPAAGVKLTGKVGAMNVAYLSALDDAAFATPGNRRPLFNLLRLRRDVGAQSTVGLSYTDRTENSTTYNRVAAADARIIFAKLYYVQLQGAASFTGDGTGSLRGPLWEAVADRTGRHWGFHYSLRGIHPEFSTRAGFVPRSGIVSPRFFNRITTYGAPGAVLENFTTFIGLDGTWQYDSFFDGHAPLETTVSAQSFFTLRGGWSATLSPSWNTASFDPEFYAGYAVERHGANVDTVAFAVPNRLTDVFGLNLGISTPQFPGFSASLSTSLGNTVAFFEPSRVDQRGIGGSVLWRPTERVRLQASYTRLALTRETDGSRFSTANIPRVKLEYQLARPLFVRFIGQLQSQQRAALRAPRTGDPILLRGADQTYARAVATESNRLRTDWLVSYRPTPGTVVFAGYGSGFDGTDGYSLSGLDRTDDGFFFKVSYLFRI
ncbi:MAG: DUF5916 domain-containing protein [Gemmatimonadota bacterium]